MGLPNCTRSLAYWTVSARTWSAAPSISALANVAARSTSSAAASSPPRKVAGVFVEGQDAELTGAVHGGQRARAALGPQIDAVDSTTGQPRRRRRPTACRRPGASCPLSRNLGPAAPRHGPGRSDPALRATQPTAAPSLSASRQSLVPASARASSPHNAPSATIGRAGTVPPPGGDRSPRTGRRAPPCPAPGRPRPRGARSPATPAPPWRTTPRRRSPAARCGRSPETAPGPGSVPTIAPVPTGPGGHRPAFPSRRVAAASRNACWSAERSKSTAAQSTVTTDTGVTSCGGCAMLRPMDLHAHGRAGVAAGVVPGLAHGAPPWPYGVGLPPRFDDLAETVAFGRRWQAERRRRLGRAHVARGIRRPRPGGCRELRGDRGAGGARAPELVGRIGINLVGPTLLAHGTPEQKERFPPPGSSRRASCGASSSASPTPGATWPRSPPAPSRSTAATGSAGCKVWTSYAQFADWGLCLTRSDPTAPKRQQGITALIIDMHGEGVVVHPLVQITGEAEFNEVEPRRRLRARRPTCRPRGRGVGRRRLHAGPRARHQSPPARASTTQLIEELLRLAEANGSFDDWRLRQSPRPGRHRGAALPAAQLALADPPLQGRSARPRRQRPQAVLERDVQAAAPDGARRARAGLPAVGGSGGQPADGAGSASWLYYQASSIFAGTNEIQRTLVGERVLGLPRG